MALIRRGIHLDTHGADDGAAAGRDPAEITRTVAEFSPDLGTLAASARAMAAAGADGMIVACSDDPARIAAIGQILAESFPD